MAGRETSTILKDGRGLFREFRRPKSNVRGDISRRGCSDSGNRFPSVSARTREISSRLCAKISNLSHKVI